MSKTLKAIRISLLVLMIAFGVGFFLNYEYVKVAFDTHLITVNRLGVIKHSSDGYVLASGERTYFYTSKSQPLDPVKRFHHASENVGVFHFTAKELKEFKKALNDLGPSFSGKNDLGGDFYVQAHVGSKSYEVGYWLPDINIDHSNAELDEMVPVINILAEKVGLEEYTEEYQIQLLEKEKKGI